jgi:hypothetical protein
LARLAAIAPKKTQTPQSKNGGVNPQSIAITGRWEREQRIAGKSAKKERWEAFRDRHGDWGRDVAMLIGHNEGGLRLRELGEAAGLREESVSMAVKRAMARAQTEPVLEQFK